MVWTPEHGERSSKPGGPRGVVFLRNDAAADGRQDLLASPCVAHRSTILAGIVHPTDPKKLMTHTNFHSIHFSDTHHTNGSGLYNAGDQFNAWYVPSTILQICSM